MAFPNSDMLRASTRPAWKTAVLYAALLILAGGLMIVLAQQLSEPNPRADFWRAARDGVRGYTSVASEAHEVLINNGGQNWRQIRNGPLAGIGPWVLAGVLAAIGIFYVIIGKDRLEEPRTGTKIPRFSLAERILHWATAGLFILMAITGLSMLFGRAVLIPVFGYQAFSSYMRAGMQVHNYGGPFFLAGVLVEITVWFKDNIPKKMDIQWFKNLGGMIGQGPRPHAGKVNGGAKAWFWIVVFAGLGIGISGLILDFPNFGQSRLTMQIAHVIHASLAVLFIAASFGHIYIGTIGAEGTFEGMWSGRVDASWAKQHQDLWYEEKLTGPDETPDSETA
ncbi:MAG: formate dehydrogenase subunit gamma [Desulfobacterales bacterium]